MGIGHIVRSGHDGRTHPPTRSEPRQAGVGCPQRSRPCGLTRRAGGGHFFWGGCLPHLLHYLTPWGGRLWRLQNPALGGDSLRFPCSAPSLRGEKGSGLQPLSSFWPPIQARPVPKSVGSPNSLSNNRLRTRHGLPEEPLGISHLVRSGHLGRTHRPTRGRRQARPPSTPSGFRWRPTPP